MQNIFLYFIHWNIAIRIILTHNRKLVKAQKKEKITGKNSALQMFVLMDPFPLTERDFRRRAAAYRNSYYRAYRQATLQGFPDKHLQFDLLVHIQTDAYTLPRSTRTFFGWSRWIWRPYRIRRSSDVVRSIFGPTGGRPLFFCAQCFSPSSSRNRNRLPLSLSALSG